MSHKGRKGRGRGIGGNNFYARVAYTACLPSADDDIKKVKDVIMMNSRATRTTTTTATMVTTSKAKQARERGRREPIMMMIIIIWMLQRKSVILFPSPYSHAAHSLLALPRHCLIHLQQRHHRRRRRCCCCWAGTALKPTGRANKTQFTKHCLIQFGFFPLFSFFFSIRRCCT